MGMGPLAWACLLLTAHGAGASDAWYMNQRAFKIPIRMNAEKRAELRGLVLYLSTDQGKSWGVQERGTPDKEVFLFTAPKDGTYWFTVATVNTRGEEEPRDVMTTPPSKMQKIVVDTTRPEVRIASVERRGGEVAVSWHVQEDHPDPGAVRVEYRTADVPEGQWLPVNVVPGGPEQVSFRPTGAGEVLVRVQATDLAGNKGEATQSVVGGAPTGAGATPAGAIEPAGGNLLGGLGDAGNRKPEGGAPARPASTPVPEKGSLPENSLFPPASPVPPPDNPPPATNAVPPPAPRTSVGEPTGVRPSGMPPAGPPTGGLPGAATAAPLTGVTRGSLPPLQVVKKQQVKLEFPVEKYGPSGLGAVEVYVTSDEGATWELAPADPKAALPPAMDGRTAGPVRGSVMVNLPREGVAYGFCIVVKSRAGLGKPPPQRGDPPQVRLELDATKPLAKLYAPQEDPAHPNALILPWLASDRNLAANPVVLEWAERKEGP